VVDPLRERSTTSPSVDEIEDAEAPGFRPDPHRSTRRAQTIEMKVVENRHFRAKSKSALGTVDRMIVFKYLQIGRLHKQQVVASDDPHQCCIPAIPLWNSHPQFRLHSGEAFLAAGHHTSDSKRVVLHESPSTACTWQQVVGSPKSPVSLTSFGLQ
jgi:hypothetical protein